MSDSTEQPGVDFKKHFKTEATFLAHTLEDGDTEQFKLAIHDDSTMNPKKFKQLVAEINDNLSQDAMRIWNLPNLKLTDRDGKIIVAQDGEVIDSVKKAEPNHPLLDAALDKPVPKLGELLVRSGICSENQLDDALRTQKYEDRYGAPHRLIGDILVDKRYCTQDQVNMVLDLQREWTSTKLSAEIQENSLAMPLHRGEGYFQLIKRLNPDMTDQKAVAYAHTLKELNGDRSYLKEGEELETKTRSQKAQELDDWISQRHPTILRETKPKLIWT